MSCIRPRFTHHLAASCAAAVLIACGGGGADAPASDATIGRNNPTDQSDLAPDPGCGIQNFEAQMLAEVNRVRAQGQQCGNSWQPPVPALSWNALLANAAMAHSNDMASHNFVSHTGSDGSAVGDRAAAQGYTSGGVGENLGGGHKSTSHLMQELLASPAHCANLMRPSYTDFGAACVRNDATVYKQHWTQVFGE
jgi:uncharacterized protein YkwD